MRRKRSSILRLQLTKSNSSSPCLVVLVHGLGSPVLLNDIVILVNENMPDADVANADYDGDLFSNVSADELARELAFEIGRKVDAARAENRPYRTVTLIGHSIGALLVRAAYLMARGEDFGFNSRISADSQKWARSARDPYPEIPHVDRLVLLGGLNKGWNAPDLQALGSFSLFKWAVIAFLITVTDVANRAAFMKSVISGSPFVHDLRMNWQRLIREDPNSEPRTIQLYGNVRGLIDDSDVNDFMVGSNFKFRSVPGVGHFDLPILTESTMKEIRLRQKLFAFRNANPFRLFRRLLFRWLVPADQFAPNEAADRRQILVEAIAGGWDANPSDAQARVEPNPTAYDDVVFLRHGIRDEAGTWVANLKSRIQTLYPTTVSVDATSFGRFSMLQFLVRGVRMARVYRFMDQYLDLRVKHWNARFHFFGHSYGTYIGCKALRDYRSCNFVNVVFGNSVMARDFPWHQIKGHFDRVLNLRGHADFVVTWFPGLFEWCRASLPGPRASGNAEYLGSAGFSGFDVDLHAKPEILAGAHSASTSAAHHDAIARFLLEAIPFPPPAGPRLGERVGHFLVALVAKFPPLVWIAVLAFPLFILLHYGIALPKAIGGTALILWILLQLV